MKVLFPSLYIVYDEERMYHFSYESLKHELISGLRERIAYHTRVLNFKPDVVIGQDPALLSSGKVCLLMRTKGLCGC